MIDGRIVSGAGGFAGEWATGRSCARPSTCLRLRAAGCLDTAGSARGLERLYRHLGGDAGADSRAIVGRWRAGDGLALQAVDLWADLVSGPLAMVVNTVGATVVPVGGGLSQAADLIALLDARPGTVSCAGRSAAGLAGGLRRGCGDPGRGTGGGAGMGVTLEVCVDTAEGLDQAIRGGADRVELCSALALGGLTPSPGLMRLAARRGAVMAMVRPRAGGFVPGPDEMAQMEADIAAARAAGLAGVVFGASLPDGRLDLAAMARLVAAAQGMEVVLHRAFDLCPDPDAALEQAVALGVTRILTSGGQARPRTGCR